MLRALIVAILLVAACGSPTASPSPSLLTAAPTLAAASPTRTAAATPSPSPTATLIPLPSFAQLSAPSGTVVWALVANARLFRSVDRGDTWTERPIPAPVANLEIAFVSESDGLAALVGPATAQCAQQTITLSHTTDAGASWQAITPTGIAPAQCKEALSFADPQHVFLSAWDP